MPQNSAVLTGPRIDVCKTLEVNTYTGTFFSRKMGASDLQKGVNRENFKFFRIKVLSAPVLPKGN